MCKKVLTFMMIMVTLLSLVGCATCISTDYETVEVNIVDECYRSQRFQPICTGKTTVIITHPAVYKITVEYDGVEYTISGSDTYEKYKDKVGQSTIGTLEVRSYDDGTTKYNIISLE